MNKKKVAFLAYTDYGNTMTYWSHAINTHSSLYESKIICIIPHQFNYDIQHDIDLSPNSDNGNLSIDGSKRQAAIHWLLECDHIIFAEEMSLLSSPRRYRSLQLFQQIFGFHLLELKAAKASLKLYIHHCGIDYRQAYKEFDEINDQYFDKILIGVDLYRLSPKTDKHCVPVAAYQSNTSIVETINIIEKKFNEDVLRVFHAPSSHTTKGTESIKKVVQASFNLLPSHIKKQVVYEETVPPVPNAQIIDIKKKSHIYIDQFHQEIGGYGISSVEALAFGNIVLSSIHKLDKDALELQCLTKSRAEQFPIIDTTMDLELFQKKLLELFVTPMSILKKKAIDSFNFYNEIFTFESISKRFEEDILIRDENAR
ncbi:MAG: hypothetical protein KC646_15530 [Candidatus Cloacimonetes bacterium]|nr:hypothetical protein [Candidatus Cloacimonadota bacterium]